MQQKEFKLHANNIFEQTCDKCGHLPICSVFRAFAPLMRKEFEKDMPINPIFLGKICTKFVSAESLRALEEGL